jgi:dTDP-4-amino-4,6-dideoxygalactose transaminase
MFSTIEGVEVFNEPSANYYSNYWLTAIRIDQNKTNGKSNEKLRLALEKENIESRPLWKPMHLQPIFENYPYSGKMVAQKVFENGLCLPSGSNLSQQDCERINRVIQSFYL